MVRTVEQILGLKPMNQMDRAAVPMRDAFVDRPDLEPFDTRPNEVDLTSGLTGSDVPTCASPSTPQLAGAAVAGSQPAPEVPAQYRAVHDAWTQWEQGQHLSGPDAEPDHANPDLMNRLTWYGTYNWSTPYPGDSAVLRPDQVPGAALPGSGSD